MISPAFRKIRYCPSQGQFDRTLETPCPSVESLGVSSDFRSTKRNTLFELAPGYNLSGLMSALAKKNVELGSRVAKARGTSVKSLEFYREVARCLPTIMQQYKLGELTSLAEMRRNVSDLMRKNSAVKDPAAVDILIYKGREELEMILMNHKQRHHLISHFVHNPAKERVEKVSGMSPFLEAFYKGR